MTSDGDAVEKLRQEGLTGEQWVRYDFTFFGNAIGASEAAAELRRLAFEPVIADEEVSGDGYWHVAAFAVSPLQEESFEERRRKLEDLARRFGGEYTGWKLAQRGDGSLPDPRRPLR